VSDVRLFRVWVTNGYNNIVLSGRSAELIRARP
jgi:hypothetical protein